MLTILETGDSGDLGISFLQICLYQFKILKNIETLKNHKSLYFCTPHIKMLFFCIFSGFSPNLTSFFLSVSGLTFNSAIECIFFSGFLSVKGATLISSYFFCLVLINFCKFYSLISFDKRFLSSIVINLA